MSETISVVPATSTPSAAEREAQILAEAQQAWDAAPANDKALVQKLYPILPEECAEMDKAEFYTGILEACQAFLEGEKRIPRTGAELDAWMNSKEEFTAYLTANPLPVDASAALATEPIPAPPAPEAVNPGASKEEVNKALAKFERTVGLQADMNYQLAEQGADYVRLFLLAAPGVALRSKAVEQLAAVVFRASDDVFTLSESEGVKKHAKQMGGFLAVNAVRVLIGDGSGQEKGDGQKRQGRARKGKDAKLPWGKIREFSPLVSRKAEEHKEDWSLHQSAGKDGEKAKELLSKVCDAPDLTAAEIREAVRTIRRDYALACGDKEEAKRWGYSEPAPVAPATPATAPAAPPADASATPPATDGQTLTVAPATPPASEDKPADGATAPATDNRPPCNQGQSILVTLAEMAKKGTPKDTGFMLAKTIAHGDDVLALLDSTLTALADTMAADAKSEITVDLLLLTCVNALKEHKKLTSKGKRACHAAHVVLTRKDSPSPAEIAQATAPEHHSNGQLASA